MKAAASDQINFRINCWAERIDRWKTPVSLIMDTVEVSVFGPISRVRTQDEEPGKELLDEPVFNMLDIREDTEGVAMVNCLFQWETPQGGSNGVSRIFKLKRGLINSLC